MGAGCIPAVADVAVRAPYGSTAHVYAQLNELKFSYTDTVAVTLDKTELVMVKGREKTLTASVSPVFAQELERVWSSSNEAVATVENGVVKGLEMGEADITLEVGGVKAVCHVTVKDKVCDAHWEGEQYIQEDGRARQRHCGNRRQELSVPRRGRRRAEKRSKISHTAITNTAQMRRASLWACACRRQLPLCLHSSSSGLSSLKKRGGAHMSHILAKILLCSLPARSSIPPAAAWRQPMPDEKYPRALR